jgi:hypothetical protein
MVKSPHCDKKVLETIVWLASLLMMYKNHTAGLTRDSIVSLCEVGFKGLQSIDYSDIANEAKMVNDRL